MRVPCCLFISGCIGLYSWHCCAGRVSDLPNTEKYVIIIVFRWSSVRSSHSSEGFQAHTLLLLDRQVNAEWRCRERMVCGACCILTLKGIRKAVCVCVCLF